MTDDARTSKVKKAESKLASQATPTHDMTYQNVDSFDSALGLLCWYHCVMAAFAVNVIAVISVENRYIYRLFISALKTVFKNTYFMMLYFV